MQHQDTWGFSSSPGMLSFKMQKRVLTHSDSTYNNHLGTAEPEGTLWIIDTIPSQGGPVGESNTQPLALQTET